MSKCSHYPERHLQTWKGPFESFYISQSDKQIYHSLFESHLGYAISVWGGISSNQLKPLFVTQKKCVRILFGDFEKYVDKFKTCARTRPINKQNLGSRFYEKESTKPLFTRHELLAVENLYRSRCIMEMFKTVKSHVPVSLCCLFNPSTRKDNLLITPNPTHQFIYKSAWLWNQFRNTTSLTFSSKYSAVKNYLRQSLLGAQSRHGTEWNNLNFTEFWSKCLYFISTLSAIFYRQIAM